MRDMNININEKESLRKRIDKIAKDTEPKRNYGWNFIKAFGVGGIICAIAEVVFMIFNQWFVEKEANSYTILTMIFFAAILTAVGIYDKLGQFAGCGSIIPITGFANSMVSSAMESKPEGLVVGILNNVFKMAGSVIVVAVASGILVGFIRYIGGLIFG